MATYVQELMYFGTRVRPVADVVAEALEAEDAASVNRYLTFLMAHAFDTNDHLLRHQCDEIKMAHGWKPFQGPPASENNLPPGAKESAEASSRPAELCTPEARALWQRAQAEGWVDAQWQPVGLSRPDAALLAHRLGKLLGIDGWKPFETLWKRQNMRQDYAKSQYNQKTDDFERLLKRKL